jgi:hypothetical protein
MGGHLVPFPCLVWPAQLSWSTATFAADKGLNVLDRDCRDEAMSGNTLDDSYFLSLKSRSHSGEPARL